MPAGSRIRAYAPVVLTAAVLATVPLVVGGSGYFMAIASATLVLAAYAVAFNLLFGSTRQLFLCLGALAGVSGYTSVILSADRGWPLPLSLSAGVLIATVLGGLFSWLAVRRQLEVIFVGIVTLVFSLVFTTVVQGSRALTGGETGRVVTVGGQWLLSDPVASYYLLLVVVTAFLALYRLVERSHLGWAFRALKDDPLAAELAGIDVARSRITAGLIGSAMLGLAGGLFAHHEGFISPASYAFAHVDVRVLVLLAFGGIGSLLGPIVGAVALGVVDEVLRPLGQLRLSVYGAVLVVLFLGVRRGVAPVLTDLLGRARRPGR